MLCLAIVSGGGTAFGFQQSAPTVRHHRVAETENATSPEVEQAEAAMQGKDLDTAEALLKKAVAANPADYRAWFDLGFVYTQRKRTPEAIDAYRKQSPRNRMSSSRI